MTEVVKKSRVTQSSTTENHTVISPEEFTGVYTGDDINVKSMELHLAPEQNVKPSVSVQQLNEKVAEAGGMPKLTEKQMKKQEAQSKKQWSTMISRREAHEMVQQALGEQQQNLQLLFIQVQSLFEVLTEKNITTPEEMEGITKEVVAKIYGTPPVQEGDTSEGTK